ncbi:MAG: ArsR family transcriptional regulator [Candidatus Scalindua sp. AMX11]|nr:MAG: ArsR family transcriptional regulator [Candidatus Scalindua sp.]NOG82821.1 metalloregulator ArsR/SmtB family transcription factor [Planctomycetota bacterium]RZV86170.1 MAG: metalloregulator ArsR/SmtB family transcription factor [Candidatus Scalindua sp. SCAELEC01]TDE65790.1 MAG: ArsR family transcriptional regulator [Candidatus Scalindua sp. AMX11]GJQ58292.1 MAG: transcriptional regulator [Candidatus Scalindua sp.]
MVTPDIYFKCLSDATRLRCMVLLYGEGELCVCELTYALQLSQPKISRHLAQLRQCGLLDDRRQGQWVYYKVNADLPAWSREVLSVVAKQLTKSGLYDEDHSRLQSMKDRPGVTSCCG